MISRARIGAYLILQSRQLGNTCGRSAGALHVTRHVMLRAVLPGTARYVWYARCVPARLVRLGTPGTSWCVPVLCYVCYVPMRLGTSRYVPVRFGTSLYVSIRPCTSRYVSVRLGTSLYVPLSPPPRDAPPRRLRRESTATPPTLHYLARSDSAPLSPRL